jgi:hypothetical protein
MEKVDKKAEGEEGGWWKKADGGGSVENWKHSRKTGQVIRTFPYIYRCNLVDVTFFRNVITNHVIKFFYIYNLVNKHGC